jgi:hypothetical protein
MPTDVDLYQEYACTMLMLMLMSRLNPPNEFVRFQNFNPFVNFPRIPGEKSNGSISVVLVRRFSTVQCRSTGVYQ